MGLSDSSNSSSPQAHINYRSKGRRQQTDVRDNVNQSTKITAKKPTKLTEHSQQHNLMMCGDDGEKSARTITDDDR